ncbi:MAG: ferritin-like domain-containing protein [Candidatus Omnitrophota bacterium]
MGKHARSVSDLNLKELVKELNKLYCDEWLAFYLYWYIAKTASGRYYMVMRQLLEDIARQELEHARELADLITKLGDVPTANPMDLEKHANFSYTLPPKNSADINRIIRVVTESEAGAIEAYHKLAKKAQGKDFHTSQVLLHILAEEIDHEERFENLSER